MGQSCLLIAIWKYFQRIDFQLSVYFQGYSGPQSEILMKKYKSHWCIPRRAVVEVNFLTSWCIIHASFFNFGLFGFHCLVFLFRSWFLLCHTSLFLCTCVLVLLLYLSISLPVSFLQSSLLAFFVGLLNYIQVVSFSRVSCPCTCLFFHPTTSQIIYQVQNLQNFGQTVGCSPVSKVKAPAGKIWILFTTQ